MVAANERERQLLERIAAEGKATKIAHDELRLAKVLEGDRLLFLGSVPVSADKDTGCLRYVPSVGLTVTVACDE